MAELVRAPRFQGRSSVCAFEGADAASKGGSICRIAAALGARQYQVIPVGAPTEEERAQPYQQAVCDMVERTTALTDAASGKMGKSGRNKSDTLP